LNSNNENKNGFIISASNEFTKAFNAFNHDNAWSVHGATNFWIKIECPEAVRIHKFAVNGASSGTITNWKLQATNDGAEWKDIFENIADANGRYIDQTHIYYESDSLNKYSTYRILVSNSLGDNPGLSHWQLFTVDALV
jgi:hypothetical protein